MPVYIAVKTSKETTPYYTLQGLASFAPVAVSAIVLYGISFLDQPAYAEYAINIGAFMAATALNMYLPTGQGKYNISGYKTDFSLRLPPVYFKPAKTVPVAKLEEVVGKFSEEDPEIEQSGKVNVVIINKPTVATCNKLANSQSGDPAKQGYITPSDLIVSVFLNRLIALFLSVHTYEAKETAPAKEGEKGKFERVIQQDHTASSVTTAEQSVRPPLPERTETAIAVMENYMAGRGNTREDKGALNSFVKFFVDAHESGILVKSDISVPTVAPVAKPSPHPYTINCGGVRDVPQLPGLLFPYFDRMMVPDKTALPYFFVRSGFYKIASSDKEFMSRLSKFGATIAGQMYLHIMIGICLSMETKTRLYVIMSGQDYLGFCLLGTKFTITIAGEEYSPVSASDLVKEVAALSSHDEALSTICSILADLKTRDGKAVAPVKESDIGGTSVLAKVLSRLERIPSGKHDEFNAAAKKLRFNESFLPMEGGVIKNALLAVASRDPTDYIKHPKHIDAKLDYLDPVVTIFASFGPEAPSPLNKKGSQYRAFSLRKKSNEVLEAEAAKRKAERAKREAKAAKEKKVIGAEPPLSILQQYEDPAVDTCPAKFLLPKKATTLAIADWKKFLAKGVVQMDEKERAAAHRCVVVVGAQVKILWKAMCYTRTKDGSEEDKDEDEDGERKAKRRKFSLFDDFDLGEPIKGKGKAKDDDEEMGDASSSESDAFSLGGGDDNAEEE